MNTLHLAVGSTVALLLNGCVLVSAPPPTSQATAWNRPSPAENVVAASSAPKSCADQNQTPQQVFAAAKNGIAVLNTESGQGSAFVVGHEDGRALLITNAHVVEGATTVRLQWADGSSDQATVVANAGGDSPQTDLALLAVDAQRGTPLQLSSSTPQIGQNIYVIGAPQGLEFSLSSGVLSQLRMGGDILQTDAAINGGNSGGPVLDAAGCVVGVATFILKDSQGLNFAVSSKVIDRFLSATPTATANASSASPGGCFFQSYKKSQGENLGCNVTTRTNNNGHTVYDVAWSDGYASSYVFWSDGSVEIISKANAGEPGTHKGQFRVSTNGVEIASNEGSVTFLPDLAPKLN